MSSGDEMDNTEQDDFHEANTQQEYQGSQQADDQKSLLSQDSIMSEDQQLNLEPTKMDMVMKRIEELEKSQKQYDQTIQVTIVVLQLFLPFCRILVVFC